MKKILVVLALSLLAMQPAMARKGSGEHGHGGGGDLPPGLQKKDSLPPGWQKKLNKGARLDDDVYRHAVPLTRSEASRYDPPASGYVQMRIENKMVEMDMATHRIRAVLSFP